MGTTTSNTLYQEVIVASNYDGLPLPGLSSVNFLFSFILDGDEYSDSVETEVSEVGNTGKYILSVTFPQEGFWLVQVDVSNSTEVLESHFLNVKVKDGSGTTVSVQRDGTSLGPVDTFNFTGDGVTVSRNNNVVTVSVISANQLPGEESGNSSIDASVDGVSGTLVFSSEST